MTPINDVEHNKPCPQERRIEKIEFLMDKAISETANNREILIELRTLLTGKIGVYDKHVEDGEKWRSDIFKLLISACLTGFAATVGFGIWVGTLSNQIEVNTNRLTVIEGQYRPGLK